MLYETRASAWHTIAIKSKNNEKPESKLRSVAWRKINWQKSAQRIAFSSVDGAHTNRDWRKKGVRKKSRKLNAVDLTDVSCYWKINWGDSKNKHQFMRCVKLHPDILCMGKHIALLLVCLLFFSVQFYVILLTHVETHNFSKFLWNAHTFSKLSLRKYKIIFSIENQNCELALTVSLVNW